VPGSLQFPLDSLTVFGVYWTSPLFPFTNVAGFAKPDPSGLYQLAAEPDTFALFCTDFPDTNYFSVPFYYDSLIIAGDAGTLDFVIYHSSVGVNEEKPTRVSCEATRLYECRPNPFTGSTSIRAEIPNKDGEEGSVKVYDASGRVVRVLCNGGSGVLSFTWEGRDDRGRYLPGGIYFIGLELPNLRLTRKAVLVR
jgi:hypothetical protein